jgi:hypothetical protein
MGEGSMKHLFDEVRNAITGVEEELKERETLYEDNVQFALKQIVELQKKARLDKAKHETIVLALKQKRPDSFTVEEISNYITSQDSLGDVAYNLSAENIIKANKEPEYQTLLKGEVYTLAKTVDGQKEGTKVIFKWWSDDCEWAICNPVGEPDMQSSLSVARNELVE